MEITAASFIFLKLFAFVFIMFSLFLSMFVFDFGRWCARIKKVTYKGETIYDKKMLNKHKTAVKWMLVFILFAVGVVEVIVQLKGFSESPKELLYSHYFLVFCFVVNLICAIVTGAWFRDIHEKFVYFVPVTGLFVLGTGLPMFIGLF